MSDLIRHYVEGTGSLTARLRYIERRLDDMHLPGYRRDGADSAEFFPKDFQIEALLDDFTGSNQILVTDHLGEISTLAIPPFGWIGRDASGGILSGSFGEHSFVFRTGDDGVEDGLKTGTMGDGAVMMKTRGGDGFIANDLLLPLTPGYFWPEMMGGSTGIAFSGATSVLDWDGPYLYSTNNTTTNAYRQYAPPLPGDFRPGVRWWFATNSAGMGGGGSNPNIYFNPGSQQRINGGSATLSIDSGTVLTMLMSTGVHGSLEHFVLVQF